MPLLLVGNKIEKLFVFNLLADIVRSIIDQGLIPTITAQQPARLRVLWRLQKQDPQNGSK